MTSNVQELIFVYPFLCSAHIESMLMTLKFGKIIFDTLFFLSFGDTVGIIESSSNPYYFQLLTISLWRLKGSSNSGETPFNGIRELSHRFIYTKVFILNSLLSLYLNLVEIITLSFFSV